MTAQKSINHSYSYFKVKQKANSKITILLVILSLFTVPLVMINAVIYLFELQNFRELEAQGVQNLIYPNFPQSFAAIAVISGIIMVLIGIFIVINNFKYLHDKNVVDMNLSLPITTDQRFITDFFGGLLSYIGPFIASMVVSFVIAGIGNVIVDDFTVEGVSIFKILFEITVCAIVLMLMLYTLTALIVSCCGSLFEASAYSIGFNILIPVTVYLGGNIFLTNLYGINFEESIFPLFYKTSPIGIASGFIFQVGENNFAWSSIIELIIVGIVYSAIMYVGTYLLYKRRKAEQVGKPFVYKTFYYICITLIIFCIGAFFQIVGGYDTTLAFIIMSAIAYLILELITNRGFKKIWVSAIRYVVTLVAIFAIIAISNATGGFGAENRVPAVGSISNIQVSGIGISDNLDIKVKISDKETIEKLTGLHKYILEQHKINIDKNKSNEAATADELLPYYNQKNYDTNIKFVYNLRNKSKVVRNYNIPSEYLQEFKDFVFTDDAIESLVESMRTDIYNNLNYDSRNNYSKYTQYSYNYFNVYDFTDSYGKIMSAQFTEKTSKETVDRFLFSLEADLKEIDTQELIHPTSPMLGYITNLNISVTKNFRHTLSFLAEEGYKQPFTKDEFKNTNGVGFKLTNSEYYGAEIQTLDDVTRFLLSRSYITITPFKSNYYFSDNYGSNMYLNISDKDYEMAENYIKSNIIELNEEDLTDITEGIIVTDNEEAFYFYGKEDAMNTISILKEKGINYRIILQSAKLIKQ